MVVPRVLLTLVIVVLVGSTSAQNGQYTVTLPPGVTIWDICYAVKGLVAAFDKCYEEGDNYVIIHGQSMGNQCKAMTLVNECIVNLSMTCPPIYRSYQPQLSPHMEVFKVMCGSNVGLITIEEFTTKFWDHLEVKWLEHLARMNAVTTSAPASNMMMTSSIITEVEDLMQTTVATMVDSMTQRVKESLVTSADSEVDARTSGVERDNKYSTTPLPQKVTNVPNKKTLMEILTTARGNDTPKENK